MSQAQLAAGPDRLPWLADEPKPKPKRGANPALAAGVLVALAAATFWIGARGWLEPAPPPEPVTMKAPPVRAPATAPQPEVKIVSPSEVIQAPVPEVRLERPREVRIAPPRPVRTEKQTVARVETITEEATQAAPPTSPAVTHPMPLKAWPAWQSTGAKGRIVRIGSFGTREQAKRGWWAMVRSYPAVAHLKATVVGDRNSRGRHFYRFQIGTTSQAHSEVLCQRMEQIRFSCAVIGLPWKPKGVER
jgi:hypothetical protein